MPSVLRANQVRFQGPVQLDLDPTSKPRPEHPSTPCLPTDGSVRVVENRPEYAVVELTCACGQKTYVRCEYAQNTPVSIAGEPKLQ